MISYVSQKIAETLCEYVEQNKQVDYLRYGIEIIIRGTIKILTLLLIAYLFGILVPMISVLLTFITFRFLTGGFHYSTYLRCLIAALLIMVTLSFITIKIAPFFGYWSLLALLCGIMLAGLYLSFRYAPSNHFYKKMTDRHKEKLKKLSIVAILLWGIVLYFLIINSFSFEIILASLFGFLFQIVSIHPQSYIIVNKMEKLMERRTSL